MSDEQQAHCPECGLSAALSCGDMVLTEQGEWTRDNPDKSEIDMNSISCTDAMICALADYTEAGKRKRHKRLAEFYSGYFDAKPSWWARVQGWLQ